MKLTMLQEGLSDRIHILSSYLYIHECALQEGPGQLMFNVNLIIAVIIILVTILMLAIRFTKRVITLLFNGIFGQMPSKVIMETPLILRILKNKLSTCHGYVS